MSKKEEQSQTKTYSTKLDHTCLENEKDGSSDGGRERGFERNTKPDLRLRQHHAEKHLCNGEAGLVT